MQEFTQWAIFLGFIALLTGILYAYASGWIHTRRTQTESFKEWLKLNGSVVRMMCWLVLIVCISIAIYKYADVKAAVEAPPTLMTD